MANSQAKMISDQEIVGKSDTVQEEVIHVAELTEDERRLEKKLVRKIDCIIMPMILLVYLLNWIDRWVFSFNSLRILTQPATTMRRLAWRVLRKTLACPSHSIRPVFPFCSWAISLDRYRRTSCSTGVAGHLGTSASSQLLGAWYLH